MPAGWGYLSFLGGGYKRNLPRFSNGRTHFSTDPEKTWVSIIALSRNLLGKVRGIRSHSIVDGIGDEILPNYMGIIS